MSHHHLSSGLPDSDLLFLTIPITHARVFDCATFTVVYISLLHAHHQKLISRLFSYINFFQKISLFLGPGPMQIVYFPFSCASAQSTSSLTKGSDRPSWLVSELGNQLNKLLPLKASLRGPWISASCGCLDVYVGLSLPRSRRSSYSECEGINANSAARRQQTRLSPNNPNTLLTSPNPNVIHTESQCG